MVSVMSVIIIYIYYIYKNIGFLRVSSEFKTDEIFASVYVGFVGFKIRLFERHI